MSLLLSRPNNEKLAYVSIRQHTSAYVRICQDTSAFLSLARTMTHAHQYAASGIQRYEDKHIRTAVHISMRTHIQKHEDNIYSSTRRGRVEESLAQPPPSPRSSLRSEERLVRQYLYFCTSKASKLSTGGRAAPQAYASREGRL